MLREWIPKLVAMAPDELAELPGVSPSRAHQIVPGALVAEGCMDIFDLTELEVCPWALREGVILERLDQLSVLGLLTRIGLSTSSVYPESSAHAFGYAASLGYDAVEVMVIDALSQSISAVKQLSEHHEIPVSAIHSPCLLFTQRVWGTEPWGKLERSAEMAQAVGAEVVVVHPPFRWQKEYARDFVNGIAALEESTGIAFAVENMYPWRASTKRGMEMYMPGWDPSAESYANTTIDLSHAAIAQDDPIAMADRLGPRLRHIHLTDGSGSAKDEHLVPGRGERRCRGVPAPRRPHRLRRRDRGRDQHPQGLVARGAREGPSRVARVRARALPRGDPLATRPARPRRRPRRAGPGRVRRAW